MNAESIFYILLLISASVLCIAVAVFLGRITKSIKEIEADIKDLSLQVKPLIASTNNLTEKLNYLSEQAKGQIHTTKSIVDDFRDRADKILLLEEKIRHGIEEPVDTVTKNLSAIVNGISKFWNAYKNR
jgi:uncharacterized protein YoxC